MTGQFPRGLPAEGRLPAACPTGGGSFTPRVHHTLSHEGVGEKEQSLSEGPKSPEQL